MGSEELSAVSRELGAIKEELSSVEEEEGMEAVVVASGFWWALCKLRATYSWLVTAVVRSGLVALAME